MAELQAVPALRTVLHHGAVVTGCICWVCFPWAPNLHLRQMLLIIVIFSIESCMYKNLISYFRASHGTRQMSKEEISECYGEKHIWTDFNSLNENPIQHCMSDSISHG